MSNYIFFIFWIVIWVVLELSDGFIEAWKRDRNKPKKNTIIFCGTPIVCPPGVKVETTGTKEHPDANGCYWHEMTIWVADGDDYRKGEHPEKFLVYGKELP